MKTPAECLAQPLLSLLIGLLCFMQAEAATYTLTVQTNGLGVVVRNPVFTAYPEGSSVTLSATAASGWYFSHWSGDETSSANPLYVSMTGNKSLVAHFLTLPLVPVTLTASGLGYLEIDPPGGAYLSNTLVSITAVPTPGWVFTGWSGGASGNTNPLAFTVEKPVTITAQFAQLPVVVAPASDVTINPGETAIFSPQVQGHSPLTYTWYFQGTLLPGQAGRTLVLENVKLSQEGTYTLVVSNAFGQTWTSARLKLLNQCIGANTVGGTNALWLREAVGIGGLVKLCFNGTVHLSSPIRVTKDVVLDGTDRVITISGSKTGRIFEVSPGVKFAVTNVTLANGIHQGTNGLAAIAFTRPPGDGEPGMGGAILNQGGQVVLASCVLSNNHAIGGRGGFAAQPYPVHGMAGPGLGGAIYSKGGSLVLQSTRLVNNVARGGEGLDSYTTFPRETSGGAKGGAIHIQEGAGWIDGSLLISNVCTAPLAEGGAAAYGGAVYIASGAWRVSNTVLAGNSSIGAGLPPVSSQRPSSAYGGALAIGTNAEVSLYRSHLLTNAASGGQAVRHSGTGEAKGGAVYNLGSLGVADTQIQGNRAVSGSGSSSNTDGQGGGIYNAGSSWMSRCAVVMNEAVGGTAGNFAGGETFPGGHGLGGGLHNRSLLSLTNCTVALNTALGGSGAFPLGVPGSGLGGGIYSAAGEVFVIHATVATNRVGTGTTWSTTGVLAGANIAIQGGQAQFLNTLLAYPGAYSNAVGVVSDLGHNMSSDPTPTFESGTSFNNTDPLLEVLGYNGGPTMTMPLQARSPAVDFAAVEGAPTKDQRGFSRPSGAAPDIGAYEWLYLAQPRLSLERDNLALKLSFAAQPGVIYVLQSSPDLKTWTTLEQLGPPEVEEVISRTLPPGGGQTFFRVIIE